ncbi:oxidoreductase HTATIP2-like [Gigantopelta aegis]|uniref:oxidoreductase HTATIP2-like n=1 Tax=Gigantopelta aegis TaxID=1735272 RepID=UPI001B88D3C0|nr:oxidoreductase HTATIP2-like [Gigantopelta aegis]
MAGEEISSFKEFQKIGHSAFILGYTGKVGKALTKELAKAKLFKKVFLIGRRQVQLDGDIGEEFEQIVVDFEKIEDYADIFKDIDVGFCCLGTTTKNGTESFVRVDHDYVIKSAELAKSGGCKHFNFISTKWADRNGTLLYIKTKGQVEEALKVMHFNRLSVFRPGGILGHRDDSRLTETVATFFLKPVTFLFPTAITIPVEMFAKAMIKNTVTPADHPVEILENKDIHAISGSLTMCHTDQKQAAD